MNDPATFGVDTEDIYGLAEFFRLKYNSLENLRNEKSQVASSFLERGAIYLCITLNIDNFKVSFSLRVLVEKRSNGFNSLNTGMLN